MFEAMRKNPSVHWFRIAFLAVLWMSSRGAGVPCVEERVLEYLGYEFMTAQWHSYKGKGASLTLYFRTLSARLNTADILKLILHEDNLKCGNEYIETELAWENIKSYSEHSGLIVGSQCAFSYLLLFYACGNSRVSYFGLFHMRIVQK